MQRILVAAFTIRHQNRWEIGHEFSSARNGFESVVSRRRPATREQSAPDISRTGRHPRGLATGNRCCNILGDLDGNQRRRSARTARGRHRGSGGPAGLFFGEGMLALALVLTIWVMRANRKPLVGRLWIAVEARRSARRFWQGAPYGFAMLSVLMGLMAASRVFSFGGRALTGGEAVRYGLLYLAGFILVAFFEEFAFRGYMQATLASAIGFWPAAVLLAVVFGALHLGNKGEAKFGAVMAGAFGLLAAFTLWRTGNLWFAIGMHGAWDWGESFFYGVPDSGVVLKGHLMNASFHGSAWLTGGTVGPEGSILVAAVLALAAIGIHYIFPKRPAAAEDQPA